MDRDTINLYFTRRTGLEHLPHMCAWCSISRPRDQASFDPVVADAMDRSCVPETVREQRQRDVLTRSHGL